MQGDLPTTIQTLPCISIRPILQKATPNQHLGDTMMDTVEQGSGERNGKTHWWWRAEAVANSLAGAVVVAFRGCWHGHMSWPVAIQGYSYQVCLSCGAKRLFDERTFSAYGPFCYDLNELMASGKNKT
jgi:hypothetical protein